MIIKASYFLIYAVLIIFLSGCLDKDHKKIVVQQPDGFYKEVYIVFRDSIKDGKYIKFYPDGKMWDSCAYKMNKLEGQRKLFSKTGQAEIIENYKDGVMDGDYFVLYPNGKPKLKQTYVDGVLTGISFGYHPNGNLREKVTMKNNEENGGFEEYYEDGKLHWKGTYLNGNNEQDTLYEYSPDGELIKKMLCQMGVCHTIK